MSEYFFTSDPHLGHDKEFVYKSRGFSCIQEHDEIVIQNWNELIRPNDEVWIAGDVMMGADHTASIEKLKRLNGKLHFKRGNHDSPSKFNHYLNLDSVDRDAELYNTWSDQLKFGKWLFHISHHPTILSDFEFINPAHKHFCLHGHTHSKDRFQFLQYCCYNIALDAHDNKPVNIEEVKSDLRMKISELVASRNL